MNDVTQTMAIRVRDLQGEHLDGVIRIDALHTGQRKPRYWSDVFRTFLAAGARGRRVALAAEEDSRLVGYLIGEVRAFEFGSEPCGWIFAVGVDPRDTRQGVASALVEQAFQRFRAVKVERVRTMVRRDDVEVLSFFRGNGFVGGRFVQLERELEEAT